MIIKDQVEGTESTKLTKAAEAAQDSEQRSREDAEELPPPYVSPPSTSQVPPSARPSNFISISRTNGKIKDTFVIDPTMAIPSTFLESQQNLYLHTMNGGVKAETYILPAENTRVTMLLKTINGGVECKVNRLDAGVSPAISLEASSINGGIHVFLPRSFHGAISASVANGSVKLSEAVAAAAQQNMFTQIKGTSRYFIGDTSRYREQDGKGWMGDDVLLRTMNGGIKLSYVDEVIDTRTTRGFFGKLFGHLM